MEMGSGEILFYSEKVSEMIVLDFAHIANKKALN